MTSLILPDITWINDIFNMGEPHKMTFHSITGRTITLDSQGIKRLFSIKYIGEEVLLKEIILTFEPDGKLSCYFAHSWRSKDHPDKIRIIKALEQMKIDVIDPFNGEDDMCSKYDETDYYPNCNYKLGRDIWVKDLSQIREADMFLMWVDSSMPGRFMGTSYELAYAFNLGKHIQIISDLRHPCMAYVLCHGNRQYNTIEDFENQRRIRWK